MKLWRDTDETNERKTFFIFGFTFRPFIKAHPSVDYHVFFLKLGSPLCSPYNFFFVSRCLQLLFTASDWGGSSPREQKNWHRLTSKRLINNTRKSSGMKWGTSVMALKWMRLVKVFLSSCLCNSYNYTGWFKNNYTFSIRRKSSKSVWSEVRWSVVMWGEVRWSVVMWGAMER